MAEQNEIEKGLEGEIYNANPAENTEKVELSLETKPETFELSPEDIDKIRGIEDEIDRENYFRKTKTYEEIKEVTQKRELGDEKTVFKPLEPTRNTSRGFKRFAAVAAATFFSIFGIKSEAKGSNLPDSLKNKNEKVVPVKTKSDSLENKTAKVSFGWVESDEMVGDLILEAKARIPFSDSTKEVMVLKFSSGTAEEMIAAAKKAGYQILSAKDFQKMYAENKKSVKDLRQTFTADLVEDIDDTKTERYQQSDDDGVKTNIKKTHGVYPYIGLSGELGVYEQGQELNYEAGLAVYKERKTNETDIAKK